MKKQARLLYWFLFCFVFNKHEMCAQKSDSALYYLSKTEAFRLKNIDSVRTYGEAAARLAAKNHDLKTEIEAFHQMAFNFREDGQYDAALNYALEGKAIALELKDSSLIANNDYLLGGIYFEKDNFSAAEKNYLNAIRLYEKLKQYDTKAYAQNGLANVYSFFHKNREAAFYYSEALETSALSDNKRLPGTINNNLGNFYVKLKEYDKAQVYLEKAAEIFSGIGSYHDLSSVYFNCGFINVDKKNYDFAIINFKKCVELGKQYHLYEDQRDAYSELEKVYKLQNNYEKAYQYADSFRVINEKLHAENLEKKTNELEVKFNLQEKNAELKAKELEIKKDEERIRAEDLAIFLLIGLMLLLSVFSAMLFYVFKKNKTKNKFLEKQHREIVESKDKINKTLADKEMLLKEVHHRVKNNLQIISSLLNLQSSTNTNEEVRRELNNAKGRIDAISMVHRKLYANDNIGRIDAYEYITELLDQQSRALFNNKTLGSIINTNSCSFNLNTSVPLGIIINELITNCFKYAFESTQHCELKIEITDLKNNSYRLLVCDNGIGFPPDFDIKNLSSLGMEIISSLTEQLNGNINLYNNNGACIEIIFTENK